MKIFADGPPFRYRAVQGYTTNPTLLSKETESNYERICRRYIDFAGERPISIEVLADDPQEMERQARIIASWGDNVYVKIPITDTKGVFYDRMIRKLQLEGLKLNITAVMTAGQVQDLRNYLVPDHPVVVSIFCGRISDTGRDAAKFAGAWSSGWHDGVELLWASSRSLEDLYKAEECGFHIITLTAPLLAKIELLGMDLAAYSRKTVQQFYDDAVAAGFKL